MSFTTAAAAANRVIMARRLLNGLRRLGTHYAALAAATGTSYSEDAAWAEYRQRVAAARSTHSITHKSVWHLALRSGAVLSI